MTRLTTLFSAIMLCSFLLLSGCQSIDVSAYRQLEPRFDLYSYFQGKTWGRGLVFDRSGRMTRQFIVAIDGTISSSGELTLDEAFRWNDGEKSTRIWTIQRDTEGKYSGSAGDVVGMAQGKGDGNSFNWHYTLTVVVDGTSWNLSMNDWMFLQEGNILFNRAIMSKFGFKVGEVFIVFSKDENFG